MTIPTIEQLMKCYSVIAVSERAKSGRPGKRTVENALAGMRNICVSAGIPFEASISRITRKAVDMALGSLIARGVSRLTARSYVWQMRSVFARWTRPYYVDAGWKVKELDLPNFRVQEPRYHRPSSQQLLAVKAWYNSLSVNAPCVGTDGLTSFAKMVWFAVTMMLEFAVRNGDVLRLMPENFVEKGGMRYLNYVPHKTELTSGRRVFWPVHPDIWAKIESLGGIETFRFTDSVFEVINKAMRSIGFRGSKGAYELRKICIDHIYQKYGAEMATSISGDDIKTISRYYADPAQPNIGVVRVIDLL